MSCCPVIILLARLVSREDGSAGVECECCGEDEVAGQDGGGPIDELGGVGGIRGRHFVSQFTHSTPDPGKLEPGAWFEAGQGKMAGRFAGPDERQELRTEVSAHTRAQSLYRSWKQRFGLISMFQIQRSPLGPHFNMQNIVLVRT